MRDPNRLFNFYNELCRLHMTYQPDIRFGQFVYNFNSWLKEYKHIDIFFPEENEMIIYLKEYCGEKV